jgi:hypothetical protein
LLLQLQQLLLSPPLLLLPLFAAVPVGRLPAVLLLAGLFAVLLVLCYAVRTSLLLPLY